MTTNIPLRFIPISNKAVVREDLVISAQLVDMDEDEWQLAITLVGAPDDYMEVSLDSKVEGEEILRYLATYTTWNISTADTPPSTRTNE